MFAVCLAGLVLCLAQNATDEISCKWLIGGLVSALIATNGFWALWVKALLKEAKDEAVARVNDLKEGNRQLRDDNNKERR